MARVLLADLDQATLIIYGQYLEAYFDVWLEDNRESAEAILLEKPFDIVVADLAIVRPDNWHFLRWLRSHWPEHELPVIVLTPIESLDLDMDLIRHQANGWLPKVRQPEQRLIAVMQALLGGIA